MMFRLACRSLMTRPIRAAVLAAGFRFGIAVMAELLGVGHVILEQARSPALNGGGDLVVRGPFGSGAECALCDIKRAGRAGSCRSCSHRLAIQTLPCFLDDTERTSCRISDRRYSEPRTVFGRFRDRRDQIVDRCTRRRPLVEARIGRCPPRDGPLSRHSRCSRARPVVGRVVVHLNGRTRDGRLRVYVTFLVGPQRRHARQTACDRPRSDRARWPVQQLFSP